ncbi:MAG: glutathione S-transferase family protein [Chloroflexaceae bacterium]|nr:glutathione S-transferase family protein [Chloroflexaceae bacterium]
MLKLYTAPTPNGKKPLILLEELSLDYSIHRVDLGKGEQFLPDYVALNPNSKIPTLVDGETEITVFESGAILLYLAEKTGQYLPETPQAKYQVIEWLMFQMASVGPMFGQLGHFLNGASEPVPYAMRRYEQEVQRLCRVLDGQFQTKEFIAGAYSIADMAIFPWVAAYDYLDLPLEDYPHLLRWFETLQKRGAVQQALALLS